MHKCNWILWNHITWITLQMKAVAGMKMSYQVQQAILGSAGSVVRGFRLDESNTAQCSHLYSMVRANRQHRRAFLISLLNLFDDSSVSALCVSFSSWRWLFVVMLRTDLFHLFVSLCLSRRLRWTCCCSSLIIWPTSPISLRRSRCSSCII